ncbi:hypothetical protein [Alicyclobacillus acidiphilus]|uniref:hypothetical protein n=1 Tax=Alicyclobacillus acidiphilus TaxID=182455 RepID=UPI000AC4B7F1|nr:hypothetical protein [Alicyclobacillus acidiphilus]
MSNRLYPHIDDEAVSHILQYLAVSITHTSIRQKQVAIRGEYKADWTRQPGGEHFDPV